VLDSCIASNLPWGAFGVPRPRSERHTLVNRHGFANGRDSAIETEKSVGLYQWMALQNESKIPRDGGTVKPIGFLHIMQPEIQL